MLFPVAATQSMWGKAFKYFPVKVVYLISILIFEIGSLLCGELRHVGFSDTCC
jgi:hypothetical protein